MLLLDTVSLFTGAICFYRFTDVFYHYSYSEGSHNCYDFVLEFLLSVDLDREYPSIRQRTQFIQDLIIPKTSQAAKYISIFRKVAQDKVVIQTKM